MAATGSQVTDANTPDCTVFFMDERGSTGHLQESPTKKPKKKTLDLGLEEAHIMCVLYWCRRQDGWTNRVLDAPRKYDRSTEYARDQSRTSW